MRSVLVSPSRMPERLFPLVEDLERSVQWTDLASNIGDLEQSYHRRRTRKNQEYDNLERHTVRRRSMPEIQKANLVYVHRESTAEPILNSESSKINKLTWKPRTDFERSYFGDVSEEPSHNQSYQNQNSNNYRDDLFYAKEICLKDNCQVCLSSDCPICFEKNCQICLQGSSQFSPRRSGQIFSREHQFGSKNSGNLCLNDDCRFGDKNDQSYANDNHQFCVKSNQFSAKNDQFCAKSNQFCADKSCLISGQEFYCKNDQFYSRDSQIYANDQDSVKENHQFCPKENQFCPQEKHEFSLKGNQHSAKDNHFYSQENYHLNPSEKHQFYSEESFQLGSKENHHYSPKEKHQFSPKENRQFSTKENRQFSPKENHQFSPKGSYHFSPKESQFSPKESKFSPKENHQFSAKESEFSLKENEFNLKEKQQFSPKKEHEYSPQENHQFNSNQFYREDQTYSLENDYQLYPKDRLFGKDDQPFTKNQHDPQFCSKIHQNQREIENYADYQNISIYNSQDYQTDGTQNKIKSKSQNELNSESKNEMKSESKNKVSKFENQNVFKPENQNVSILENQNISKSENQNASDCKNQNKCDSQIQNNKNLQGKLGSKNGSTYLRPRDRLQNLKNEKSSFSGSRERLQEIFEYNRYLRKQFFADMPASNPSQRRNTISEKLVSPMRAKHVGTGFGSTETLTSQSNQSADDSTNGRKSRADFSNTPDSVDDDKSYLNILRENEIQFKSLKKTNVLQQNDIKKSENFNFNETCLRNDEKFNHDKRNQKIVNRIKEIDDNNVKTEINDKIEEKKDKKANKMNKSLPKIYFGMENNKNVFREKSPIERSESYDCLDYQNRGEKLNSLTDSNKSKYEKTSNSLPSKFHQSLPNLPDLPQLNSIARVSVNGSTYNLSTESGIQSGNYDISRLSVKMESDFPSTAYTYKPLPMKSDSDDSKFFATYVNISDSSDSKSSTPSSIRKRKKNVPPPLDLSTVNERYERYDQIERNFLPTYTVDITKVSRGVITNVSDEKNYLHTENQNIKHNSTNMDSNFAKNRDRTNVITNENLSTSAKENLKNRDSDLTGKNLLQNNENIFRKNNQISSNRSKSSTFLSNNSEEREENEKTFIVRNKSCCDLTNSGDLLSPQLVNNFKNSLADLSRCATPPIVHDQNPQFERGDSVYNNRNCSPQWDHWNQNNKLCPTSGTTLSSVYGPIPYSQYCDKMKMSNLSIFFFFTCYFLEQKF